MLSSIGYVSFGIWFPRFGIDRVVSAIFIMAHGLVNTRHINICYYGLLGTYILGTCIWGIELIDFCPFILGQMGVNQWFGVDGK